MIATKTMKSSFGEIKFTYVDLTWLDTRQFYVSCPDFRDYMITAYNPIYPSAKLNPEEFVLEQMTPIYHEKGQTKCLRKQQLIGEINHNL